MAFVKEGEEHEKEQKAWPVTCGTRRGDRRGHTREEGGRNLI